MSGTYKSVRTGQQIDAALSLAETSLQPSALSNIYTKTETDNLLSPITSGLATEVTARQGADTTLQANITAEATARAAADVSLQGSISNETTARQTADTALGQRIDGAEDDIEAIEAKIPNAATSENQLADKSFVNSSISTSTATFRGNVIAVNNTEAAAQDALTTIVTKDNNDYANVIVEDYPQEGVNVYKRYTYNGTAWVYNFPINSTEFTSVQWGALNSGATAANITSIAGKYVKPAAGIPSSDLTFAVQTLLSKADSAYQKPASGIPSTDMTQAVQTSLGKADTALQSSALTAYRTAAAQDTIDAGKASKPSSEVFAVSSWSDLASADPFTVSAIVTAQHTIGASTVVELINNNAVAFANYGFQIGAVNGQAITLYAIEAPTSAVNITINFID